MPEKLIAKLAPGGRMVRKCIVFISSYDGKCMVLGILQLDTSNDMKGTLPAGTTACHERSVTVQLPVLVYTHLPAVLVYTHLPGTSSACRDALR